MIFELAEIILGALAEIICGGFSASAPLAEGATVVVGVSVLTGIIVGVPFTDTGGFKFMWTVGTSLFSGVFSASAVFAIFTGLLLISSLFSSSEKFPLKSSSSF